MGIKIPQFSSCCFCLPLRTGLLTLGYINLIYHSLICILVAFVTFTITAFAGKFPLDWTLLIPLVTGSEVVFNILVVVATHKKEARLLKITFIFGTALWIFTVLYSICITYRLGQMLRFTTPDNPFHFHLVIYMTVVILEPIILGYVLLLVRSLKSMVRAETPGLQCSELNRKREARADYEQFHDYE